MSVGRKSLYFVYPKDKNGKRSGYTVALMMKDGAMFHGISLCSANDPFNKSIGRALALGRAEKSYQKWVKRNNELEGK